MQRVMIFEPMGNLWGSERFLLDFLADFPYGSWAVGIAFPQGSPIETAIRALPVTAFPLFERGLHSKGRTRRLFLAARLLLACYRFRPDLIYANQVGAGPYALAVARVLKIPVVVHVQWHEDAQNVISWRASSLDLPAIVCMTRFVASQFPPGHIVKPDQLITLYDPYVKKCDWSRSLTRPASRNFRIICVARLDRHKGQDVLLEAVTTLRNAGVPAEVLFLGSGAEGDHFQLELITLATQLQISDNVIWAGHEPDVLPKIAEADVLVLPSHIEALGRVVWEAWDAGTIPVVWQGSGGPAELVAASGGGVIYEEQQGSSLARAIQTVSEMAPHRREDMVEKGRAWLEAYANPESYAREMTTIWQRAIEARRSGRRANTDARANGLIHQ